LRCHCERSEAISAMGGRVPENFTVWKSTDQATSYYGCNAFPLRLKFYRNQRAVSCDREFVGA